LLGDTTELDSSEAGRDFRVTGLSHLVAVSGSHLVVIALLISWLIRRLGLRRSVEVAIITVLLVSYVFLTGLQPSAIRACVMTFIASMAAFAGRRGHIPSALAAAAVGMLLLYPPAAFSVGFWLSVFAVFGLTIFCPLITRYFSCLLPSAEELPAAGERRWFRVLRGVRRSLIDPFSLTVTAQMATLPITAPLFATVSLVSPLANLLVTPFITLLVGAGIAALCLMPLLGPLGPFLLGCLCAIADLSILLAAWCARLPCACLAISLDLTVAIVCALLIAAALYHLWPQPSRRRCLVCIASFALGGLLFFASTFLPVSPQVVMFDVGQGDAILIREGRSNILIDTGPSDSALLRSLARQRVSRLNAVIITHLDEDHCGALDALSGTIAVDHVFFAAGLPEARPGDDSMRVARMLLKGNEPEELARGDTLTLGTRVELVMLWPDREVTQGGNEESVCLGLNYDSDDDGMAEFRMLLTGDAESPQLAGLLAKGVPAKGAVGTVNTVAATNAAAATGTAHAAETDVRFDILKIGHHGSSGAVTSSQLEHMGCRLALISVGKNNRYGHPTLETLSVLEQAGVAVYRTDFNGEIALRFEAGKLIVRCDTIGTDWK
jgi:competence protein ComEC